MWYDEIELLKPSVTKNNSYRYYRFHQNSILEIILMLRELNISISEIQAFLQNRSVVSLENLLCNSKYIEIEMIIEETKKYQLHRLYDVSYCSVPLIYKI